MRKSRRVPPAKPDRGERKFSLGRWLYAVVSLALVAPCFWHSRIEAGDLGSHVYNVWLAQLVSRGQAPGLTVRPQATNILFDLLLSGLNTIFGMDAAQRIAVTLVVLVFAWGAFAFASAVAGRAAWTVMPAIAMVAYGFVYHVGFFNFYLSLGLCLWAMALAWHWSLGRGAAAAMLIALAFVAHALPVAWALGLMAYRWAFARIAPERRRWLAAAALGAMLAARGAIALTIQTRGSVQQMMLVTGVDQLIVFDGKYGWMALLFFVLWISWLSGLLRRGEIGKAGVVAHFCLLSAAAVVIFPTWVAIPGYKHALAFIAERMSLPMAVCVCALAAGRQPRAWQLAAMGALALVFFGMLYRDEGVLCDLEDRIEALVARLPPGQRVVCAVNDPGLRAGPVTHMIDRACVGRCYSYANYEPSTAQFRVRVTGPNPIVAATYGDSLGMQDGQYTVKPEDLPLYVVGANAQGMLELRSAAAGMPVGSIPLDLL